MCSGSAVFSNVPVSNVAEFGMQKKSYAHVGLFTERCVCVFFFLIIFVLRFTI